LAFFECRFLHECPAGDHVLAVGEVVNGEVLDSRAKPLSYRDTEDGASALFPDALMES
jgi:flavin reductase (DIM6/NTAB) family NADH-FMN oxidoreductase RutF